MHESKDRVRNACIIITQVSEFKIAKIQSIQPFTHTPNAG